MKLNKTLLVLAATAALAGCYVPSAPDEVLYGNVVATNYKQDANFAAYPNVLLNDTIAVIDDTGTGISWKPGVEAGIIDQIRQNLIERGYTEFVDAAGAGPDTLKVGAYAMFGSVALFYSDYWCSWYYYYYCYPTTSYAGSYNYGTLLIEAGKDLYTPGQPPVTVPPGGQPPFSTLVWTSATYGVLAGGNSISTASPGYQKVLGSIDQAFAQSPYFTRLP
jgi:hypothetical protein